MTELATYNPVFGWSPSNDSDSEAGDTFFDPQPQQNYWNFDDEIPYLPTGQDVPEPQEVPETEQPQLEGSSLLSQPDPIAESELDGSWAWLLDAFRLVEGSTSEHQTDESAAPVMDGTQLQLDGSSHLQTDSMPMSLPDETWMTSYAPYLPEFSFDQTPHSEPDMDGTSTININQYQLEGSSHLPVPPNSLSVPVENEISIPSDPGAANCKIKSTLTPGQWQLIPIHGPSVHPAPASNPPQAPVMNATSTSNDTGATDDKNSSTSTPARWELIEAQINPPSAPTNRISTPNDAGATRYNMPPTLIPVHWEPIPAFFVQPAPGPAPSGSKGKRKRQTVEGGGPEKKKRAKRAPNTTSPPTEPGSNSTAPSPEESNATSTEGGSSSNSSGLSARAVKRRKKHAAYYDGLSKLTDKASIPNFPASLPQANTPGSSAASPIEVEDDTEDSTSGSHINASS